MLLISHHLFKLGLSGTWYSFIYRFLLPGTLADVDGFKVFTYMSIYICIYILIILIYILVHFASSPISSLDIFQLEVNQGKIEACHFFFCHIRKWKGICFHSGILFSIGFSLLLQLDCKSACMFLACTRRNNVWRH